MNTPPCTAHKTLALVGVNLTILMSTLDVSIVNVALPTLVDRLDTTFATVQWVIVSYLLVVTSMMLSASRLGDMLGKKRLFLFGVVVFTAASLLCGLAPSVGWLIAFRALQGVGAVMIQALGAAIIAEVVPRSELGKAMGYVGGTVSLGLSAGPSLGGVLIGLVGWRSIFLINVPIGLISWWIVQRSVPRTTRPQHSERFDLPGAVILFFALGSYALGMTQGQELGFDKLLVQGLLAGALVGLAIFIWWQVKSKHPMLDLSLFRNLLFSLNLCMGFMVFVGLGSVYILPFFFELVQGYSPVQIGLLLVIVPASMGLVSPLAGSMSDRFGSRGVSIFGLALFTVGAILVSTMQADSPWWGYLLRALPMGVGLGFFQAPNNSAIMGAAPAHRLGVVSGLMNYSRTIGQTTGIPLQGAIFTAMVLAHADMGGRDSLASAPKDSLLSGFGNVYNFVALLGVMTLCLGIVAFVLDAKKKKTETQAQQPEESEHSGTCD